MRAVQSQVVKPVKESPRVQRGENGVVHYPRLDTVFMVEDAIKNAPDYWTVTQLWKHLPRQVMYPTLKVILDYFERNSLIMYSGRPKQIVWVGGNPKLDAAIRRGKEAIFVNGKIQLVSNPNILS